MTMPDDLPPMKSGYDYARDAKSEQGKSGRPVYWLSAAVVVVVVFFLGFYTGQSGRFSDPEGTGLPVIESRNEPVKVKPEDPGGLKIPHQDKKIYERITGGEDASGASKDSLTASRITEDMEEMVKEVDAGNGPVSAPPVSASVATQDAIAPAKPAVASSNNKKTHYRVQISSWRSESDAQKALAKALSQYPEIKDMEGVILKVNIPEQGVFYRAQLQSFTHSSDKAFAQSKCNSLKREGVDCFVVSLSSGS
ncbi:MAG: SPOR domain-containing protein [Parvularculales bacterium]